MNKEAVSRRTAVWKRPKRTYLIELEARWFTDYFQTKKEKKNGAIKKESSFHFIAPSEKRQGRRESNDEEEGEKKESPEKSKSDLTAELEIW